jgi:hypothetical protein
VVGGLDGLGANYIRFGMSEVEVEEGVNNAGKDTHKER